MVTFRQPRIIPKRFILPNYKSEGKEFHGNPHLEIIFINFIETYYDIKSLEGASLNMLLHYS